MATRAALKLKEAFVQYSKKMCTAVTVFWMCYRLLMTILIFFKPSISSSYIKLTEGVDTVMIANISIYASNSISEKAFVAFGKNKLRKDEDEKNDDEEKKDDNG